MTGFTCILNIYPHERFSHGKISYYKPLCGPLCRLYLSAMSSAEINKSSNKISYDRTSSQQYAWDITNSGCADEIRFKKIVQTTCVLRIGDETGVI